MNRSQLKTYIIVFSSIFMFLLFITWQHVVIFNLGYRITSLKKEIQTEEIQKQKLMKDIQEKFSLNSIEASVINKYSMAIPGIRDSRILELDQEKLLVLKQRKRVTFISYLKSFISPREAVAR